ncbi:MAG: NAD(P)-dependent oxidoreductase [Rhodothermales bacterium]
MLYKRVLITGANGLLGQELVKVMSQHADYDILATGRDIDARFPTTSCGYVSLDITNHTDVKNLFIDFTPDVVINCAALTNVDQCEQERQACWDINCDAVEHIIRRCKQHTSKLIQVSTDFVFDGKHGPYREEDRPNPQNFYGRSKLAAENAIRKAGLRNWAIARTVLVYGTGDDLRRSNIVLWAINQLSSGNTIRIVDDQWRTPTYAPDLAEGLQRLVRYEKNGVYNLSGRDFLSMYDFVQIVASVFDLDASLIDRADMSSFSQTAIRPQKTGFIILKAESEFGFKPKSVEKALAHLGARLGLPVSTS